MFSPESIKAFGPKPGQGIKIQVKEAECEEVPEVVLRTNNLNAPSALNLNWNINKELLFYTLFVHLKNKKWRSKWMHKIFGKTFEATNQYQALFE